MIHLYAGSPIHTGSSVIYEIVYNAVQYLSWHERTKMQTKAQNMLFISLRTVDGRGGERKWPRENDEEVKF